VNRRWKAAIVASVFGFRGFTLAAEDRRSVEVQVEVTEIDQTKASSLGVNWFDTLTFAENVPADFKAVGSFSRLTGIQADLHFLIQEGAAELLANPNLITDSGTMATFEAGGQIPYITSSSLGSTHVEFKPYGVLLKIEPTVLDSGLIQMKVKASVSAPDETHGASLSGNTVPALFEREVTSDLTVRPGATITLAGLVQTQKDDVTKGVPLLRKIPILGSLFRWRQTHVRRTTIVMFMTPKMINL